MATGGVGEAAGGVGEAADTCNSFACRTDAKNGEREQGERQMVQRKNDWCVENGCPDTPCFCPFHSQMSPPTDSGIIVYRFFSRGVVSSRGGISGILGGVLWPVRGPAYTT